MIGTLLTPSQYTKGSINRSLSVNIPWAPEVFSPSFLIVRGSKARSAERKKQLCSSRKLYQAVSMVYFILFREKTPGVRELWTQIIELILLTMSTDWLNTLKKNYSQNWLSVYLHFSIFLFKSIFLPFFSFNLKATFKEELYQKFYHRHYDVALSVRWDTWTHAKHYSTLKYSILFIRFYCLKDLAKIVYIKTFFQLLDKYTV